MRSQLSCSRLQILSHLSRLLINTQTDDVQNIMTRLLAKCLDNDFVNGSIIQNPKISNLSKIDTPILVNNGENDFVVDGNNYQRWQQHLKPGDCYQKIKNGRHFFPFEEWRKTSKLIEAFITMVPEEKQNLVPDYYKHLSISKPNS